MGIAIVVFLTVVALGGAVLAFAGGSVGRPSAAARLGLGAGAAHGAAERARAAGKEAGDRRKSIETALKEIDEKKTANKKVTVRSRLDQAGFPDTPERKFWIVVLSVGVGLAALCLIDGRSLWVALAAGLAGGGGAPIWTLNYLKRRRERRFTSDFAAAITRLRWWPRSSRIRWAANSSASPKA
jgi:tight adherence protein B